MKSARPGTLEPDMSGGAIEARLRAAGERADLRPERRLHAKLDMSGPGIERRIKAASQMLILCRRLAAGRR
jgi:hypothetical protein